MSGTTDESSSQASGAFAPSNPTDSRPEYDWESRWHKDAIKLQKREGWYLAALGVLGLGALFTLLSCSDVASQSTQTPGAATSSPRLVASMGVVFCAGILGGTAFSVKWWYHTIARGIWHTDRWAWRIAVPWVAAIAAMFVHILFKSDLIGILNPAAMDKIHNTLAFGFLVGYFSDAAIAKLAEIAESLFGARRERSSRGTRGKQGE